MRLALFFVGATGFSLIGIIWMAVTLTPGYEEIARKLGIGVLVCAGLMIAAVVLPIPAL